MYKPELCNRLFLLLHEMECGLLFACSKSKKLQMFRRKLEIKCAAFVKLYLSRGII